MASPQAALREPLESHLHVVAETCPVCDQPIPNDKAEAVRARMEARERALAEAARADAARQIAAEKAHIEAAANATIENGRLENAAALQKVMDESAAREAAAHAAGKNEGDAVLQERVAAAEQAKADAEAASQDRIAALEEAATAREADWQEKLTAAELAKLDSEAASRERIAALEQAVQTRDSDWQEKLTAAEQAIANAQAAAQERFAALEEAARARDADWQDKIAAAERAKQGALSEIETLRADHERAVSERVHEARDAMEKDKTDALNAEKAKHAEETQKLSGKLETLTRQLEKKTAEELGEGAEVKLFDALRAEFDGDRIERVSKGVSGADIIHTVIHNGRECGKIIYDSKNSTAWRDDYVSKLVQDQTAAKADHAILSTFKFPAGAKHVEVRESVIIVNPSRAIVIAHILRRQIALVHTLRLSKSERAQKMAALFDFIMSPRCGHLLGRIDTHADAALKLQEKEIKAHAAHWKQEGTLLRSIQKVKAELQTEIDAIIGTNEPENDHEPA